MKLIHPFTDLPSVLSHFDNGGRFYNIMTDADDGEVTSAELAKAAGVLSNKQQQILYFEAMTSHLSRSQCTTIVNQFSDDVIHSYQRYRPITEIGDEPPSSIMGKNVMIDGVAEYERSNDRFSGFIMVPIITNNVTTMTMIPLIERYDVYRLNIAHTTRSVTVAHTKGATTVLPKLARFSGVVKALKNNERDKPDSDYFIELNYLSYLN